MMTQNEMICIGCQECCKWVSFTITFYNQKQKDDLVEFYTARGFKINKHHIRTDCIEVMIKSECPKLTKYGCRIYSKRPEACRQYDGRKDPLMMDYCKLSKGDNYEKE